MGDFEKAARDFLWEIYEHRHDDSISKDDISGYIREFLEEWPETTVQEGKDG